MASRSEAQERLGYQVFVLTISLAALLSLLLQATMSLDAEVLTIFAYTDDALCVLFFVDFLYCVARAPNCMQYLVTWGWVDLFACAPTVDIARWGRLARALRICRVLRAVRAGRVLAQLLLERKAENSMLAVCLVVIVLVFASSVAILHCEKVPDANIKSPEDALWWSIVTVTTVGYGDRFPVTSEGRIVASILMCAGVGMFGTFSAYLASLFVETDLAKESNDLAELRAEVADLRRIIEERLPVQ